MARAKLSNRPSDGSDERPGTEEDQGEDRDQHPDRPGVPELGRGAGREPSPPARRHDRRRQILADVRPRGRELLVVGAELDAVAVVEDLVDVGRFRRVELAPFRARAEHEVVALLVERDAFASGEPREPRPDRGVVDPLRQQHRALPRRDPLRRDELDRRQLVHLVVGHESHSDRRVAVAGGRVRERAVGGIGGSTGEHLVAATPAGDHVHEAGAGEAERDHRQREDGAVIGAALGDIRDRRLVDGREPDDRAADGDAVTRFERADDGAVHVAVAHELASARLYQCPRRCTAGRRARSR